MKLNPYQELARRDRYRQDPLSWAVDFLGIKRETIQWSLHPEYKNHEWKSGIRYPGTRKEVPCQDPLKAILDAVGAGQKYICVKSARGTGKTFILGNILTPWFPAVYPQEARVFTFAPTEQQLKVGLWKEIESNWWLFKELYPRAQKNALSVFMDPSGDRETREAWSVRGLTIARNAGEESLSSISGLHDANMLFLMEEMQGIQEAAVKTLRRTGQAPNNIMVAVGNPKGETEMLSRFGDHPLTLTIRVSAYDHPNVVLGRPDYINGAVTQEALDDLLMSEEVGGDPSHPIFMAEAHGYTPVASSDCLFHPRVLESVRSHNAHRTDTGWVWNKPLREWRLEREMRSIQISEGRTRIYAEPEERYINRYIIFADVAGDRLKGDWHFAVVYDRKLKSVAATIRMRGDSKVYTEELLKMADLYTVEDPRENSIDVSRPILAYEINGVGALHRERTFSKYPRLYKRINPDARFPHEREILGWDTNSTTRRAMIDAGRSYGYHLAYYPERIPDEDLWVDMKNFVKNDRGRYEAANGSGIYDDGVMALLGAIAVDEEQERMGRMPVYVPKEEKEEDRPPVRREVKKKSSRGRALRARRLPGRR